MPDYQAKRGAYSTPLEGISSAPGVVTHVRALTMTSLRRAQEPPANGGSTGREATTLRSVRSDLKSMAQFCTQNRLDQATGKVKPRIAGSDTPRSGDAPQLSPADSPEKQEARSPEHRSGSTTLQSTSVLTASKSLRGSANSRPQLRNGGTGTRTRSPSATSFKGGPAGGPTSPAVAPTPTRLFQSRDGASGLAATAGRPVQTSTSPRTTGTAHSPKRKITQSLVVQVRPRSGSFTSSGAPGHLTAGSITSPGRSKATVRQTSAGAAVRKRSGLGGLGGPSSPPAPLPRIEEEYPVGDCDPDTSDGSSGPKRKVTVTSFDETNVVMCYSDPEDSTRQEPQEPLRLQVWWRQGGASVTISGFHPEHITAVSLCGTRAPETATPTSETSQSGGPEMEWLVTSSRSKLYIWRLDRLSKAVAEAQADGAREESGKMHSQIEAVTPSGAVLKLKEESVAKSYHHLWTYDGEAKVPPIGVVTCRSSARGHMIVASARDPMVMGKVLLYFISKQMEVLQLQSIGWSDPLSDILITDIVPTHHFPQERSQERLTVWFSGIGAKLYSCEVICRELEPPKRLVAHVNLLPNNPVSCLCGSAKSRVSRCYVGCKMAMVQIMEWRDDKTTRAHHLGKVQIPGEDASVVTMRTFLRGEEEVLAIMLEHAIHVQGLVFGADGNVSQERSASLAVSLTSLGCSHPSLVAMNNGPKSAAAVQGFLQLAWVDEDTLRVGSVKMDEAATFGGRKVTPIKETEAKTEQRRPSIGNDRGSPMTTPRGGTVRRKPLNGAGSFAPRPASSRGESNTGVEGRKEGRRMVSGPAARSTNSTPGSAGKATVVSHVARTVKRNPRVPTKASEEGLVSAAAMVASEGELQARIDRVPSPATQRQRSLEAVHHVASAQTDRQEPRAPDEQWAAKVARYQQHQTWAPPAGSSTPLWRVKGAATLSHVGHVNSVNSNPVSHITRGPSLDLQPAVQAVQAALHPPGTSASQAAPQSIQGLSSWPTVWVPQAIPAAPLSRHSMGQTLAPQAVSAVNPMNTQAFVRGMVAPVSSQVVLEDLDPLDPLSRSRRNQPFVQSLPTAHPAFLHRWPFH